MEEKLTIFIAVTSGALVLQMLIMAGVLYTLIKMAAQVKSATEDLKAQALPLLEDGKNLQAQVRHLLETSTPKFDLVLDNAAAITTSAHNGIGRLESTLNDALDRARLQIIRADEMVTRAMDSVEDTTEKVVHSVTSPVKQASGIVQGISTGVSSYFGQKRPRKPGPSDEMFI